MANWVSGKIYTMAQNAQLSLVSSNRSLGYKVDINA